MKAWLADTAMRPPEALGQVGKLARYMRGKSEPVESES